MLRNINNIMNNVVNRAPREQRTTFFPLAAKKRILTLILLVITMSAFAQEHMKFMGIPINGQLTTFCQQLEKKNFQLDKMYANGARYVGLFTGEPAYVIVETTPKTHTVCDVLVAYKDNNKWEDMDNLYDILFERLVDKYGEAKDAKEVGVVPKNDPFYDVEKKLADAELIRRAKFETEVGSIDLGIDNLRLFDYSTGTPYVYLIYIDKANTTKSEQEAFDDL